MGDTTDIIYIAHEKDNPSNKGPQTYMTGGKAPLFHAHYLFNTNRTAIFDAEWNEIGKDINKPRDNDVKGCEVSIMGKKIRNSSTNKNINLQISMETGIPRRGYEIIKLAQMSNIIIQGGPYYDIPALAVKIRGFDTLAKKLDEDDTLYNALCDLVKIDNA